MSGWKTATIKNKDQEYRIKDKISELDNKKENVKKLSHNSIGMRGYNAEIKRRVKQIIESLEIENGHVLIIEANNTSDSGNGYLHDIEELKENGTVKLTQIDSKHGYEGARANDVVGYFREEHKINGHPHVH